MKKKQTRRLAAIISFNIYLLLQLLLLNFFYTPVAFGLGMLMLFVCGFLLLQIAVGGVWGVYWMFKHFRLIKFKSTIPLLMTIASVMSFFYIPLNSIYQRLEFNYHLNSLNMLVDRYKKGEFILSSNKFTLPDEFKFLSSYGKAEIIEGGENVAVLFERYSGFDNYFGYIYLEDSSDLDKLKLNCLPLAKTQYNNNWFGINCT